MPIFAIQARFCHSCQFLPFMQDFAIQAAFCHSGKILPFKPPFAIHALVLAGSSHTCAHGTEAGAPPREITSIFG
jgi:hypothetical protein